jgi:hypothetical protein
LKTGIKSYQRESVKTDEFQLNIEMIESKNLTLYHSFFADFNDGLLITNIYPSQVAGSFAILIVENIKTIAGT